MVWNEILGDVMLTAANAAEQGVSIAPFYRTSDSVIQQMFDSCNVTSTDILADLGCGDGEILIQAAQVHNFNDQ